MNDQTLVEFMIELQNDKAALSSTGVDLAAVDRKLKKQREQLRKYDRKIAKMTPADAANHLGIAKRGGAVMSKLCPQPAAKPSRNDLDGVLEAAGRLMHLRDDYFKAVGNLLDACRNARDGKPHARLEAIERWCDERHGSLEDILGSGPNVSWIKPAKSKWKVVDLA